MFAGSRVFSNRLRKADRRSPVESASDRTVSIRIGGFGAMPSPRGSVVLGVVLGDLTQDLAHHRAETEGLAFAQ